MRYEFLENAEDYVKDSNKLHIGVVGSRTLTDEEEIRDHIEIFINMISINYDIDTKDMIFVSGGAKGVDSIAEKFALENGHDVVVIKPNWNKYNKRAGFMRNTEIVKTSDIIFALVDKPTGGTWDTIKKAEKDKKPVFIQKFYEEDGDE